MANISYEASQDIVLGAVPKISKISEEQAMDLSVAAVVDLTSSRPPASPTVTAPPPPAPVPTAPTPSPPAEAPSLPAEVSPTAQEDHAARDAEREEQAARKRKVDDGFMSFAEVRRKYREERETLEGCVADGLISESEKARCLEEYWTTLVEENELKKKKEELPPPPPSATSTAASVAALPPPVANPPMASSPLPKRKRTEEEMRDLSLEEEKIIMDLAKKLPAPGDAFKVSYAQFE